jgi:ribonuclease P protein component
VQRVFREGSALRGRRVVVFVAAGGGRVAFVAGRKVGGAVERNRARRVLRAALREVAPGGIAGRDVVVVAREAIAGARTQDVVAELGDLLSSREVVSR